MFYLSFLYLLQAWMFLMNPDVFRGYKTETLDVNGLIENTYLFSSNYVLSNFERII